MTSGVRQVLGVMLPALLLGAAGAPTIVLALGIWMPEGFLNLSESSADTVATYFVMTWLLSIAVTVPVGAACWSLLHAKRLDGFISYTIIALASGAILSLVAAQKAPSASLLVMALANGVVARVAEMALQRILFRHTAASGPAGGD